MWRVLVSCIIGLVSGEVIVHRSNVLVDLSYIVCFFYLSNASSCSWLNEVATTMELSTCSEHPTAVTTLTNI